MESGSSTSPRSRTAGSSLTSPPRPSGSEGAERRGDLRPGGRVVEYTGGSTGSSLALVRAVKEYEAHFVSSDAFAEEKLRTMRAFGANLDIVPSEEGRITPALVEEIISRARELSAEPHTFWADQYNNSDNRAAYHAMAREILDQTDERLDAFVMSDAMNTARELAVTEGIFGGTSSGANVLAALRVAADLGPEHRVVTVIVDSGLKYLDGDLFSLGERN